MLALLLALLLVGCGGITPPIDGGIQPRPTPVPIPTPVSALNPYFNLSMIGQTWTFVNGHGDHTFIQVHV